MSATGPSTAPMSALAARKARAMAAAASTEAASAPSSSRSLLAHHRMGAGTIAAGRRSLSRSPEAPESFASGSDPDPSTNEDLTARVRKRSRPTKSTNTSSGSRRGKISSRYFANGSGEPSASRKLHGEAVAVIPIEDANTGFLAFGEADDALASSASKVISEDEGRSSDDDLYQDSKLGTSKRDTRGDTSPFVLTRSRTSSPDVMPSVQSTKSFGPTIPYSKFTVDIDKNCLVHTRTAKQMHADAYTFGMRPGESLTFVGIGHVEVLKGLLQIGGAMLSSTGSKNGVNSANVFAPIYHPLPLLKALDAPSEIFASVDYPATFAASSFSTIVRISPLESSIVDLLQVCAVGGNTPPFAAPSNLPLLKIPSLATLKMLFEPNAASLTGQQQYFLDNNIAVLAGLSATYTPHAWQSALNNIATSVRSAAIDVQEEAVVALVRGPKKVGKSTLSRMVLERVLTMGRDMGGKVAFLELDLGQSDFGPPGMVSLHVFDSEHPFTIGPGWVQPRVPLKAHFIGDLSPKDDPASYMSAIVDLVTHFRDKVRDASAPRMPFIVNTQGWVKGLGADLASQIESLLCPTHIYEVVPRGSLVPVPNPIRGSAWLDAEGAIVAAGAEIITLESVNQTGFVPGVFNSKPIDYLSSSESAGPGDGGPVPPPYITDSPTRLTPADLRILNTVTYLYAHELGAQPGHVHWDFSRPLVHAPPLVVDVESGLTAGIHVLSFGSSIPDAFKLAALNASIVAIVAREKVPEAAGSAEQDEVTRAKAIWKGAFRSGRESLVPGPHTRCLGLGLVRSIDVLRSEVHLLTPLSAELLSSFPTLGLIKGALDLPIWASLDFDALKDAKESKLDVAPSTFQPLASAPQQTLAGVPRNQIPYVEWPWTSPRTFLPSHVPATSSTINGAPMDPKNANLAAVGSQKRKIRRNLMRRGQFA